MSTVSDVPIPPEPPSTGRAAGIVVARELASYFETRIAPVYGTAFILLANLLFMNEFFLLGTADMSGWFVRLPLLAAVFLPAVTMRSWAEERRQRTLEVLLALPVTPGAPVIGKFVASLGLYCIFLAGSLPIVAMVAWLGRPDWGRICAAYLGAVLLGVLFLAAGQLVSALTADQIVAFVVSAVLLILLVVLGDPRVAAVLDGLAPVLAAGTFLRDVISPIPYFETFAQGVVAFAGLVYFLGTAAVLLASTALVLTLNRP
ncbi:MAG TPA: ABC transporter permease subunit [Thermoanaerobaculia bacterium]|nr:ABC transporter permease subunit [Thermoanaerobaculia bacterium]